MKKIENKIKNSIQLPNLSFFEKLPKIEKQNNHHYVLTFASILILFMLVMNNKNFNQTLSETVIQDNIIINILDMKNNTLDKYNNKSELNYSYDTINATIEEINKYYSININQNNLLLSDYVIYNDTKNTICYAQLKYNINDKIIKVKIADSLETWNIETSGLINILNDSEKSVINNKEIVLAKYENNDYPEYYRYEVDYQYDYYHALYKIDNLYYYITSNNMTETEFIEFLKEYIV